MFLLALDSCPSSPSEKPGPGSRRKYNFSRRGAGGEQPERRTGGEQAGSSQNAELAPPKESVPAMGVY